MQSRYIGYIRTRGVRQPEAEWLGVSEDARCNDIVFENGVVIEREPKNAEEIDEIGHC